MPSALANAAIEAASSVSAHMSTGRRPTWSDRAPVVSRAASRARVYALKTTVTDSADSSHRS